MLGRRELQHARKRFRVEKLGVKTDNRGWGVKKKRGGLKVIKRVDVRQPALCHEHGCRGCRGRKFGLGNPPGLVALRVTARASDRVAKTCATYIERDGGRDGGGGGVGGRA